MRPSAASDTTPDAATPSSIHPYSATGFACRSLHLPSNALPAASPPMNTASTVAIAYTVLPNTSPSALPHATWYTSPAAPDKKKHSSTSSSLPVPIEGA